MPRVFQPLRSSYGLLTVLGTDTVSGFTHALVQCQCGVEKHVVPGNLRSGRTLTCGASACKKLMAKMTSEMSGQPYKAPGPPTGPMGPNWIDHDDIPQLWADYYLRNQKISHMAVQRNVNARTVYSLFRAINKAGGLRDYMFRLTHKLIEEPVATPLTPTNPLPPGMGAPPPLLSLAEIKAMNKARK